MADSIIRCAACDGYGWIDDSPDDLDFDEGVTGGVECRWCGGIGYVYQDGRGVSRRIPPEDYAAQSETLEDLELERLREIGYTGEAKKPWQQQVRIERGDRIAQLNSPRDDAQEEVMPKYPREALAGATPADLRWLAGQWRGDRKGDIIEEHYSDLGGNTIMGMFRWLKGETVAFYELIVVEPQGESVALRIKHFNPGAGLASWEEKEQATEFILVQQTVNRAVFLQTNKPDAPWMVYQRTVPDTLTVYFEREDADTPDADKFVYQRISMPAAP